MKHIDNKQIASVNSKSISPGKKRGKNSRRNLKKYMDVKRDLDLLKVISPHNRSPYVDFMDKSKAQLKQDLFVLSELDFKKNGYFVEFGACNGVRFSNSYLLEKEFQWDGILAEPARLWHEKLKENRTVPIDTRCVWKKSGEIIHFNETKIGEYSTIDRFSENDNHSDRRKDGNIYDVETVSLLDLLECHNAPKLIDYLSIDTEGSEFQILKTFDFDRYKFRVITCEHNNTPMRHKVYELLTKNGYIRKFEKLSKFDDWYVLAET